MNEIFNNFLGPNHYRSELAFKTKEFTYSACGLFTKHCERI